MLNLVAGLILVAAATLAKEPPAAVQRVTGKVDAVTVFSDRAVVRRTQALVVPGSGGVLRFHSLPAALVREAVRASGRGLSITGVAVRPTAPATEREWLDDPLKVEVDRLDQKLRIEQDKVSTYNEQLRLVGSLGGLTTAKSDQELRLGTIKTDGWKAAVEFLEDKREAYQAKIRASQLAMDKLQRERTDAANKLGAAQLARRSSPFEVEVAYVGTAGTNAEVTLEYTVTNVSWTAVYDLRGSAEGGPFQLISHANIRHTSGEAWDSAKITLSTARPAVGTAPGALQPWRLHERALAPPASSTRKTAAGEIDSNAGATSGGTAGASTTMTVQLPGRETIASDSSDHRVTLKTSRLGATLTHVAIPSLTAQVFLRARLQNATGMPLLGGPVAVFLDGNFVGTSAFSHLAAAGEDFDIYLGPDQRLQVKRTLVKGEVEGSGFFSKKVKITNQWQIEIANYSGKPRQVVVHDQYPVSADPSIEAELVGTSRATDRKDENGMLTWRCDVPSGRKERVDFSYSLTVPRAMWERFEAQQAAEESQLANAAAPMALDEKAPPAPMPSKARRMYNLEAMIQKR